VRKNSAGRRLLSSKRCEKIILQGQRVVIVFGMHPQATGKQTASFQAPTIKPMGNPWTFRQAANENRHRQAPSAASRSCPRAASPIKCSDETAETAGPPRI